MIVLNNRKNYDRFILRYKKYVFFKKKLICTRRFGVLTVCVKINFKNVN